MNQIYCLSLNSVAPSKKIHVKQLFVQKKLRKEKNSAQFDTNS